MGVINDPLVQTHIPASSDHYSHLKFVYLRDLKKGERTDGRTDTTCEYSDHRGLVDQLKCSILIIT